MSLSKIIFAKFKLIEKDSERNFLPSFQFLKFTALIENDFQLAFEIESYIQMQSIHQNIYLEKKMEVIRE